MGPGDTRIYEGRVCGASAAEWEVLYSQLGTSGSYLDTLFSTRPTDFVFIALHCSFMCLGFHSILIALLEDLLGC